MNLIIIISDELRADSVGFMGNPDCRTPNLDRLAQRGAVFTRHFAVHGKCVPSRIALTTGRYCHTDGFRTIHQRLPNNQPDLLAALKRRGYETALFGHNHCWENIDGPGLNPMGASFVDYHSFTEGIFSDLLKRERPAPPDGPVTPMKLSLDNFHYGGRFVQPLTWFCDDNRADQAIAYLMQARDRSRPFYLHLNISQPHPPYRVEEPYFSMYDRRALRPWPHELPSNAPLAMRQMRAVRTASETSEAAFREVQAVYYGMATKVDALAGRVLEAIEHERLWDDTVVLFTSDHGDFAGQYGLVEKWDTAMADCILRTPCILCAPGLKGGQRIASLTEHTDICPTLLELLHVAPHPGIHGESLLPVICGERRKQAVFADGGHEDEMLRRVPKEETSDGKQRTYWTCPDTMARAKMARTEKWKLVMRLRGGNELYDLETDPWEMNNLWGRPDLLPVTAELQQRMIEWCLRTDTDRPYQPQVVA